MGQPILGWQLSPTVVSLHKLIADPELQLGVVAQIADFGNTQLFRDGVSHAQRVRIIETDSIGHDDVQLIHGGSHVGFGSNLDSGLNKLR